MKSKMTKIVMAVAALLTAGLMIAGCGGKKEAAKDTAKEKKVLHVAMTATFPPFEYAEKDGSYAGIDVDIAKYVANKLGMKVEISDMKFASLIPTLQSGRADMVISGISPTDKRSEVVSFTDSYFYPPKAIVAKKGTNFTDLNALKGHSAGATMGTTYVKDLKAVDGIKVVELDSATMAVQDVLNGRLDATLCDGTHAIVFCKEHPELEMHMMKLSTGKDDTFAIAFPKNSPNVAKVNKILEDMKKNGDFHKILVKHLGEEQTKKYESMVKEMGLK
jgi:ABC-type amino acid transport substrate-binding protein